MFERFTGDARATVVNAQQHSHRLGHRYIGCEHLLLALVASDQPAAAVLREHGVTPERVEEEIVRRVGLGAGSSLFAGLDRDALASIGIDLDAVRARIEAAFGPGALAQAGQAVHRGPRRSRLNPRRAVSRSLRRWHRQRRARRAGPTGRRDNLTVIVPLTPAQATRGTEIKVPVPWGDPVSVLVPPGTPNDRTFRIRGQGVRQKDGTRADLLVTVQLGAPPDPSSEPVAASREGAAGLYQATGPRAAGHIPFTPNAKKTLQYALREALARHDDHIGVEHIALALMAAGGGLAPPIVSALGTSAPALRAAILDRYRLAS